MLSPKQLEQLWADHLKGDWDHAAVLRQAGLLKAD